MVKDVEHGDGAATEGVGDTENYGGDASQYDGAGAHGTGFLGDIECGFGETPVAHGGGDLGNGNHLGMGSGVFQKFGLVVGLADDLAVAHDDGADGNFAVICRLLCFAQGELHVMVV